jgi:sec-independent protein translocase protein TatC
MARGETEILEQSRMTFGEHLDELRTRLINALWVYMAVFVVCFIYNEALIKFVCEPLFWVLIYNDYPPALFPRQVTEVFFTALWVSGIAAFIFSSPWIFYQIWAFVAAGLYPSEKRVVFLYAPMSAVCFVAGAAFFYLLFLPISLNYFVSFGRDVKFRATESEPPWVIKQLFGDRPMEEAKAPPPATVKAKTADGKEIALTLDTTNLVRSDIPVREIEPEPAEMRPGMMWYNAKTRELRVVVRHHEVDENGWFDKAMHRVDGRELKAPRREWDVRSVAMQSDSFLAQAFTLNDYVNFVTFMTLVFGIAFQVPLVVMFSVRVGFVDRAYLGSIRRYVFAALVLVAVFITPTPDPFTQLMLGVPMYLLFELGLFLSRFVTVVTPPEEQEEEEEEEEKSA